MLFWDPCPHRQFIDPTTPTLVNSLSAQGFLLQDSGLTVPRAFGVLQFHALATPLSPLSATSSRRTNVLWRMARVAVHVHGQAVELGFRGMYIVQHSTRSCILSTPSAQCPHPQGLGSSIRYIRAVLYYIMYCAVPTMTRICVWQRPDDPRPRCSLSRCLVSIRTKIPNPSE